MVRATGRFSRQLTDHQQADLGHLLALTHGANFSVPGAGKTTSLLATYEAMRGQHRVDRLLVVAPKNAFVSWDDEVSACIENGPPAIARATGGRAGVAAVLRRDPEIVLITYQLLPNVIDVVKAWGRRHRVHVVLDESHRTKAGYGAVTAAAALQLAEVAIRRDILSGTPLPHQPEDLRPQLDFLWPGQRILPDFRLLSDAPAQVIEDIERSVRPLYVRTTKAQLALPDLAVTPIPVMLGPLQRELYELLRSEAARAAAGMAARDRKFFRALGRHVVRLIQAATNPMLLSQAALVDGPIDANPRQDRAWELLREVARDRNPAKIARAVELADQAIARGERVLVWTSFVMNLHVLADRLAAHNPVLIYGQVPAGDVDDEDSRDQAPRSLRAPRRLTPAPYPRRVAIPEPERWRLEGRLRRRQGERWPALRDLTVRYRGDFAYVSGRDDDGPLSLCRLRYLRSPDRWGFACYLASKDGYEDSILPTGSFTGTPEEALDCSCGLYLNDPSAWSDTARDSREHL